MSAEKNLELVKGIYLDFVRGDIAAVLSHCVEDIDWGIAAKTDVPWHGLGKGKAFAAKFFENLGRELTITRFEPHSFIAGEDGVACLVTSDATVKRNGRKGTFEEIHLFKIRDGRVTMWRGSEDTATVRDLWKA